MCRVFFGTVAPEFNSQEQEILKACDKVYEQLEKCQKEETGIKSIKLKDVTILTSCSLNTPVSDPLVVKKKHPDVWVEVTRPVLSCGAINDSPSLQNLLLDTLVHPPANGKLPEGCSQLVVGDKYLLDDKQSEEDTKNFVKMWAGVCPHGCVPYMTPVYAPPRRIVGVYLRPTNPPPGW